MTIYVDMQALGPLVTYHRVLINRLCKSKVKTDWVRESQGERWREREGEGENELERKKKRGSE